MTKNVGTFNIAGRVQASGETLTDGEIIRIDPGSGKPMPYKPGGEQRTQWMPYELWVFAGQSNTYGDAEDDNFERYGIDAPHPKVLTIAQGDRLNVGAFYRVPPQGTLMVAQHPFEDARGVSPAMAFAKARVERFPGIKEIAILPRSYGASGFSLATATNRWQPPGFDGNVSGDAQFNGAYDIAEAFLNANPRYRLAGVVTDLLGSEVNGTAKTYGVSALTAFITEWRKLRGGDQAIYLQTALPRAYAASSATLTAMREAQAEAASTIPRGTLLRSDDLPIHDGVHYTKASLRKLGRMMDEAAAEIADFTVPQGFPRQRMQYSATEGRYVNVYGGGQRIHAEVVETDGERGTVLRCNRLGFDTSLVLPPTEYTIALWVRRMEDIVAADPDDTQDFFVMGKLTGQTIGNAFARTVQGHHETSVQGLATFPLGTPAWDVGETFANQPNPLFSSNWCHLALTYKDGTFACYRNGTALTATGSPANNGGGTYPVIDGPRIVQIGAWGALSGVTGTPDMRFDDIVILPTALNQAAITKLYSTGVID